MPINYCIILFVFAYNLNAYSQQDFVRNRQGDVYYDANQYKAKYNNPEGSPYLDESFTPAQINNISETQFVRFNAYEGKIEVKVNQNQVVELDGADTYMIILKDGSGRIYETHSYVNSKEEVLYSFFEKLHTTDHYSLYLKEQIKYQKEVRAEAYKDAQPATFKKDNSSFFVNDVWRGSDDLVLIPERTKTFTELFPNQAKSLKNFIKQEKLKLDERDDLIRVLDYCLSQK